MSDTAEWQGIFVLLASFVVGVVATDSRNRLVLRGQLHVYSADCKDKGNIHVLNPYLSKKKTVTVVVLKRLCLNVHGHPASA